MKDQAGIQDVFCGAQTVVHMKSGKTQLAPEVIAAAIEETLAEFEIACDGVERDDTAML